LSIQDGQGLPIATMWYGLKVGFEYRQVLLHSRTSA